MNYAADLFIMLIINCFKLIVKTYFFIRRIIRKIFIFILDGLERIFIYYIYCYIKGRILTLPRWYGLYTDFYKTRYVRLILTDILIILIFSTIGLFTAIFVTIFIDFGDTIVCRLHYLRKRIKRIELKIEKSEKNIEQSTKKIKKHEKQLNNLTLWMSQEVQ